MGLLDDAIREHLDLKRRRGADPTEIERAEREALGPVRRNREPGLGDDPEASAAEFEPAVGSALDEPDDGVASDLADEFGGEEELYDEEPQRAPVRTETDLEDDDPFDNDEPSDEGEDRATAEDPFADEDDPFADEPDPHRTQLMSTVDAPMPDDATAEHDVEQRFAREDARPPTAHAGEADSEDEDVLEETPEFLQDTPDHDRLWFEQRPPKDFDFDG